MADPPAGDAADDDEAPLLLTLFEPTTDTICDFGDIILVADDGFHPVLKIRVSSCILAMSSKPFKALFSRKFAEGQQASGRSSSEPHEIKVKDSPKPLKQLCQLLHHLSPLDEAGSISSSDTLDLGVLADKYDCIEAIRLPVDALLETRVEQNSGEEFRLERMTTAAFLLDQPRHFRHLTRELVLKRHQLQAKNFERKCLDLLPRALIPSLFNQQNIAQQTFSVQLTALIEDYGQACERASLDSMALTLLRILGDWGVWPLRFGKLTLEETIERMGLVQIPSLSPGLTRKDVERTRGHKEYYVDQEGGGGWGSPVTRARRVRRDSGGSILSAGSVSSLPALKHIIQPTSLCMKFAMERVKEICVGVCLDCMKGRDCRIPHRYHWGDTAVGRGGWGDNDSDDGSVDREPEADIYNHGEHPGYWEDDW